MLTAKASPRVTRMRSARSNMLEVASEPGPSAPARRLGPRGPTATYSGPVPTAEGCDRRKCGGGDLRRQEPPRFGGAARGRAHRTAPEEARETEVRPFGA